MNKTLFAFILMPIFAGCGGGHSGGSGSAMSPNTSADAFVGTWSGTYQEGSQGSGPGKSGTISLTIVRDPSATGLLTGVRVTGTAHDSKYGAATVTGFVHDRTAGDGYASGSYIALAYASGGPSSGSDDYLGRPEIDARGHLVGTLGKFLGGDFTLPTTFDLAPAATP